MIYTIIICLLFTLPIRTMDNSFFQNTKEKLQAIGNIYNPEPTSKDTPLNEEHVLNDYWKKIKQQDQTTKDAALQNILENFDSDPCYPWARCNIAAATYAGASPSVKKSQGLCMAALKQDYQLCKLLLEKGANPNAYLPAIGPALFVVKKCNLAELFLHHGAHIYFKDSGTQFNLLMNAMEANYEPQLISLYKSKGLSPLDTNCQNNTTSLHMLAFRVTDYNHQLPDLEAKLSALFENLSQEESTELINSKQTYRGTVFDILQCEDGPAVKCMRDYLRDDEIR